MRVCVCVTCGYSVRAVVLGVRERRWRQGKEFKGECTQTRKNQSGAQSMQEYSRTKPPLLPAPRTESERRGRFRTEGAWDVGGPVCNLQSRFRTCTFFPHKSGKRAGVRWGTLRAGVQPSANTRGHTQTARHYSNSPLSSRTFHVVEAVLWME